jgi:WD40 repeat protein
VSFLSRIIGNKKRDTFSDSNDNVSEVDGYRVTGMDAEAFAQPIGFIPRYPPPPKYIKVRAHYKKEKDFDRLFEAQQLRAISDQDKRSAEKAPAVSGAELGTAAKTGKAIWALEFSHDGRYLAAAGQDGKVRVWAVIATIEDRQAHEIEEEAKNDQAPIRLSAPVFKTRPVREYEGHNASVVDLSWSKVLPPSISPIVGKESYVPAPC